MSMSNYLEDAVANALRGGGNGTSFTAPANVYCKLHTGDPGEAGTSNAAGETTRKEVTFGAASGGAIALSNSPSWTNVSTAETYSHVSLWDHLTAGNCLGSGAMTASKTVAVGDTFNLTALSYTFD
jgi:hypothetical protein